MAVIICKEVSVPSAGKMLGDYTEGDVVKIPESGFPVEFYVAKHDYESGLNGAGRTLLVRKDVYDQRQWNNLNVNAWGNCSLLSWLNSDYLNLIDHSVQELIGVTKYYYTPGSGNYSVTTRSDSIFILSITELGISTFFVNKEGTALQISDKLQIAWQNGNTVTQWTRTPQVTSQTSVFWVAINGGGNSSGGLTNTHGSRPCFTLPSTTKFDPNTNIIL